MTAMDDRERAAIRELLDAHEELVEAMYNSDLEASWRPADDRYNAAQATVVELLGKQP